MSDAWLHEVEELVETLRRPDATTAFAAKVHLRIGGERTYQETSTYLYNALYNAVRYADAVLRDAYGEVIPSVREPREPRKATRREVIRDDEGRITAVEECEVLSGPLERR